MNKKNIIFIVLFLVIMIISIFLLNNKEETKKRDYVIKTYNSDIVCKLSVDATEDEEGYTSNIYIYTDANKIDKVVYQTITETDFVNSYADLMKSFYDMYKGLDGIETSIFKTHNSVVSTIIYKYKDMDPSSIHDSLSKILEDDSILLNKSYEFKTDWYVNEYLKEYKCEVK